MDSLKRKKLLVLGVLFFNIFCVSVVNATTEKKEKSPVSEKNIETGEESQKSDSEEPPVNFYNDKTPQGFYHYIDPKEKEKQEEAKKEKEASPQKQPPPMLSYKELWNMHPDEFQAYTTEITKIAVQQPTADNFKYTKQYLKVNDVARRKSAAFASVVALVGQKTPEYASNNDTYPIAAPGQKTVTLMRERELQQTLEKAKDNYGLIMFSQEGCDFCETQRGILKWFTNNFKWPIKDIDMELNPELTAKFGVTMAPSIILVNKKSDDYMVISSGVLAADDLKAVIYRTVKYMNGDISPEQWGIHDYEMGTPMDPLQFANQAEK